MAHTVTHHSHTPQSHTYTHTHTHTLSLSLSYTLCTLSTNHEVVWVKLAIEQARVCCPLLVGRKTDKCPDFHFPILFKNVICCRQK